MKLPTMLSFFTRGSRAAIVTRAAVLTVGIAVADWRIEGNVPLGFLYLFPMLLVGSVLDRWQIAISAALCALLTELFDNYDWFSLVAVPRDILIFAAFLCMGLFVYEANRSRSLALRHLEELERGAAARADAEEQLKVLVDSSPAAVFTATADGGILLANE